MWLVCDCCVIDVLFGSFCFVTVLSPCVIVVVLDCQGCAIAMLLICHAV